MLTFTVDAGHVLKKWSTWWAAVTTAAASLVLGYDHLPSSVQEWFPHVVLTIATTIMVVGPVLIPFLTSIKQSNIPEGK